MKQKLPTPKPVQVTTNYGLFKRSSVNRPVDELHVKKLECRVLKKNMLEDDPLLVERDDDGKLKILRGQHRFEIASRNNLPVYYRVASVMTEEDVRGGEFQKKWNPKDFMMSNVDAGNANYITLNNFVKRHKLPLCVSVCLLSGTQSFTNVTQSFRDGTFKVSTEGHAEEVGLLISCLQAHGVRFATDRSFVLALSAIVKASKIKLARLDQKLDRQASSVIKCANWLQYVEAIDRIYNFKVQANNIVSIREDVRKWVANLPSESK